MDKTNKKLTVMLVIIGIITIMCMVIFELNLYQLKLRLCLHHVNQNMSSVLTKEYKKLWDEHMANEYPAFSQEFIRAQEEVFYKVYDFYRTKRVECFDKYGP